MFRLHSVNTGGFGIADRQLKLKMIAVEDDVLPETFDLPATRRLNTNVRDLPHVGKLFSGICSETDRSSDTKNFAGEHLHL